MDLTEVIIQRIKNDGPISFHDFMEMCLYYPGYGYYTSPGEKIGPKGDFYTTATLTTVFGALIARQLKQMWEITGSGDFTVVEYGAGTGMLCHDIIDYIKNDRDFYDKFIYFIIEKSEPLRKRQQAYLGDKVKWVETISQIGPLTGCVLSNELVDNFAVHQVVMQDQLMELFVGYDHGFIETLRPAGEDLQSYLQKLNINLPRGYRTEINLQATRWITEIAETLHAGFVITIDYGYSAAELYNERRKNGTLVCYHRHAVNDNPFANIGKQDITAHVNFSAISHWGHQLGLLTSGFITQADFFIALKYEDLLSQVLLKEDRYSAMKQYAALKHTLLMDMGQKYKVLVQQKAVPLVPLDCFRYTNQTLPYSVM